jgi:hypothetical protein
MNKLWNLWVLGLLTLLATACSGGGSGTVDYLSVKTDGDKWGMVGPDGKMLFSDEFDNQPSAVINGYFSVEENGGYSVYKADKKPTLVKGLEGLKSVGIFTEGLMPICRKMQRIEFVNEKGETKFTVGPINNKEVARVSIGFQDGLAIIATEEGKFGAIDTKGKVVIKPSFDYLSSFRDGYALASKMKDGDIQYCIINKKGEIVAKLKNDMMVQWGLVNGKVGVSRDDSYGFFDVKGEYTKAPSKVKGINFYPSNDKFYAYNDDDDQWGVMNFDNEVVVRAKFKGVSIREDEFFCVDEDKCVIYNTKGDEQATIRDVDEFLDVKTYCDFELHMDTDFDLLVKDGKSFLLYNDKGEQIGKEEFDEVGSPTLFNEVESDYFDVDAVATKVLNYISDTGFSKMNIGDNPTKYITGSAENYVNTYRLEDVPDVEGGYKYDISAFAVCNKSIADSKPIYKTHTETYGYYYTYTYTYKTFDHNEYYFNTDVKVESIDAYVSMRNDCYKELYEKMCKGMKNKGFKDVKKSKGFLYCTKGDLGVMIYPHDNSSMYIHIAKISDISDAIVADKAGSAESVMGRMADDQDDWTLLPEVENVPESDGPMD